MGFTIKNEQLEVVKQFLNGNDVFVTFPTGFGKSLCFAVLPGVFNVYLKKITRWLCNNEIEMHIYV